MAKKITTKFKIAHYDLPDNKFLISFQLAPGGKHDLVFTAEFAEDGFCFEGDTQTQLEMLGLTYGDLEAVLDEIGLWLSKPQAKLGNISPVELMSTRIQTVIAAARLRETIEAQNRCKAEAERIVMAAPCMDWAMSALDQLEAAAKVTTAGLDVQITGVTAPHGWEIAMATPRKAAKVYKDAIDDAVDAIHKTAIRFMSPSTMREHNFLRAVIQEEIEEVVGSVL